MSSLRNILSAAFLVLLLHSVSSIYQTLTKHLGNHFILIQLLGTCNTGLAGLNWIQYIELREVSGILILTLPLKFSQAQSCCQTSANCYLDKVPQKLKSQFNVKSPDNFISQRHHMPMIYVFSRNEKFYRHWLLFAICFFKWLTLLSFSE